MCWFSAYTTAVILQIVLPYHSVIQMSSFSTCFSFFHVLSPQNLSIMSNESLQSKDMKIPANFNSHVPHKDVSVHRTFVCCVIFLMLIRLSSD